MLTMFAVVATINEGIMQNDEKWFVSCIDPILSGSEIRHLTAIKQQFEADTLYKNTQPTIHILKSWLNALDNPKSNEKLGYAQAKILKNRYMQVCAEELFDRMY